MAEKDFGRFLQEFKCMASLTRQEIQNFENTTLDDVKNAIASIQTKQISSSRQQWFGRLKPFLTSMEQYGMVVEVFLNTSGLLAFIWGPMKFILITASNFSTALNSLLDAYFELGELIPQLSAYQDHCVSNTYMRTVLALIYKDILEFHAFAMKYFRKSTWKQVFQAVWRGFAIKLEELKDNMRRHRHLVESQASIIQFEESRKLRKLAEIKFQDLQDEYLRRRWPDIRQWLSPYNSKLQHEICARAKAECPGSGEWLLTDIRFKNWLDPVYCMTPLLWINGIPGAGKTVLASTIIEEVEKLVEQDQARLAYFYCKNNDSRNSFVDVARGLLSQLLKNNQDLMLQLYDKGNLESGEAVLLDASMAKDLLDVALDSQKPTYVIIDGIDECKRDERKEICSWFTERVNKLSKEDYGLLRCLFVSQDDGIAKKDLAMIPAIKILPAYVHGDIRRYVDTWRLKIEAKHGALDIASHPLTDIIVSSASGMFLYAKLIVRYLYGMPAREELLDNLRPGQFPEQIGDLYDTILKRIQNEGDGAPAKTVYRFLSLIAVAKRPLRWHEIQGYFAFDPDKDEPIDHTMRKLRVDPKELCWSLVEHQEDDSVELVHPTAKEHLIRTNYLRLSDIECHLAHTCLMFLSIDACCRGRDPLTIEGYLMKGYYSFFDYAAACWSVHLQSALPEIQSGDETDLLIDCLEPFLELHWSDSAVKVPVSKNITEKIKVLEGSELHSKLAQAIISARKQLGLSGKGPSPDDPLDIGQAIEIIRGTLENMVSEVSDDRLTRLRSYYGKNSDWFKCPRVSCMRFYEGFDSRQARDHHVSRHERPYRCLDDSCSMFTFGYTTEKGLQKHMFEIHGVDPGGNIPQQFPMPPPTEKRKKALSKYPCSQCPKSFTRAFNLKNHMRVHINSKPFSCEECGKAFTRRADCTRHEATHMANKPFKCAGKLVDGTPWGCNLAFTRSDKLHDHFKSATGRRCISPWENELEELRNDSQPAGLSEAEIKDAQEARFQEFLKSALELLRSGQTSRLQASQHSG